MKYQTKQRVARDIINTNTEESLIRETIHAFIQEIPIEDLKKLFKVNKIDPENANAVYLQSNRNWIEIMQNLYELRAVQYELEITIV